jgi:ArsR family transcriptional regulator, virulence genes transcriptional regulator
MDGIFELQAEVLKTLANPRRLEIIHRLAEGSSEVGRLAEDMGIAQPNLSQHLALMRSAGVVEAERNGREVRYRLADSDIVAACELMRGVLQRRALRLADLYHLDDHNAAAEPRSTTRARRRPTASATR